jgi:hypothetical protein
MIEDRRASVFRDTLLVSLSEHQARIDMVLLFCWPQKLNRDSSVGIALGYELDDRGSRVRFLAVAGNFSLHRSVQNGFGAHPASYPIGTRGSFSGGKAAGAWS